MRFYLFLVTLAAAYTLFARGIDPLAIKVWLTTSVIFGIPCYFMARSKLAPTRTETLLARVWLTFRRLVCFIGALLFGAVALLTAVKEGFSQEWLGILFMSLFALAFAWWGVFGAGERRTWSDDKPMHQARKKRYGWK